MNIVLSVFTLLVSCMLLSCTPDVEPRKISLSSHLIKGHVDEPELLSGELIEYIPNKKDPFAMFDSILVQLPIHHSQDYLKGYTFGYAAQKNTQTNCILGLTEYSSSEYYHSGYLNGGRDAMGHEKWDKLFGDIFKELMQK